MKEIVAVDDDDDVNAKTVDAAGSGSGAEMFCY